MICCPDSIGLMNRSRKPNRDSLSTWPSPWWPLQILLAEAVDRIIWIGEGQHSRESFTSVLPRNVQDRRLCARGWTRRPLSFRLLGYVTRLMRALTSPCTSSPCASSQYLRSFQKKARFLPISSAPMIFYKTPTHISIPLSVAFSGATIELRA